MSFVTKDDFFFKIYESISNRTSDIIQGILTILKEFLQFGNVEIEKTKFHRVKEVIDVIDGSKNNIGI